MYWQSGVHASVWMDRPLVKTAPLDRDISADVCIIGAGITGLLTAARLLDEGLSVVILDSGPVAGGETSRTTAHAVTALDDRYTRLERLHGQNGARLAAESHARAIDHVEALVGAAGIDCEFVRVDGYLAVGPRHRGKAGELLEAERDACRRAGLGTVDIVGRLPFGWPEGEHGGPALKFPRQAQFDPLLLVEGLVRLLAGRRAHLFTGTHARRVHGGHDAHVLTREGPVVHAAHIVVATNTPINDLVIVHTKQAGYQSYVIAVEVPVGAIAPALMWDGYWEDDDAYHYVRLRHAGFGNGRAVSRPGTDVLIVGGEDHRTGQDGHDRARHARLEAWTRERFPMAGEVVARWSGEVMEPVDGLAYIGHNPLDHRNVYVATGDSGNGMTHGAIAAMLLSDLIQGRQSPWAHLYHPSRKPGLRALGRYASENVNTLRQYGDWLAADGVDKEDQIEPGTGAIVSQGMKRLAVYRDEQGHCTRLNAVCTHLGGLVRWNAEEQTWDCPCHGSRFDKWGHVIHGPAASDLRPAREGAKASAGQNGS